MLKSEMQHQYWVTKKTVQRKLGSKEDACIVSSDAELDAKIELFKSINDSCVQLHRVIDAYQERLCILAQEENALGRFLKDTGKGSNTCGTVMATAGKSLTYCGQQRIAMRAPLLRLLQEVDTFRGRAVIDTHLTIQAMERERTEYRAALSWMKSASAQLDPDSGRGVEKFRKAQQHVRASKDKFDRYTLDCLQKIDLLAAARCNMFSHGLVAYQAGLLELFGKTTRTFVATIAALDKEPHYSFTVLKELTQATAGGDSGADVEGAAGAAAAAGEQDSGTNGRALAAANAAGGDAVDSDQMLFFKEDFKDEKPANRSADEPKTTTSAADLMPATLDLLDKLAEPAAGANSSTSADLLGLATAANTDAERNGEEFGEFMSAAGQPLLPYMPSQLLTDSMLVDLSDWAAMEDCAADSSKHLPATDQQDKSAASSGAKSNRNSLMDLFGRGAKKSTADRANASTASTSGAGSKANWMDLFAELDPLANPDLMEKKLSGEHADNQAA